MRWIQTGRGPAIKTWKTAAEIAEIRSSRIAGLGDRTLFLRTFESFYKVAPRFIHRPLDLDMLCSLTKDSPVMQAAMIEALAALRAEGVRL